MRHTYLYVVHIMYTCRSMPEITLGVGTFQSEIVSMEIIFSLFFIFFLEIHASSNFYILVIVPSIHLLLASWHVTLFIPARDPLGGRSICSLSLVRTYNGFGHCYSVIVSLYEAKSPFSFFFPCEVSVENINCSIRSKDDILQKNSVIHTKPNKNRLLCVSLVLKFRSTQPYWSKKKYILDFTYDPL